MAEEKYMKVELRDGFYRDSIGRVILVIIGSLAAIVLLAGSCVFLYTQVPPPIIFPVSQEFRVQPPVPLDQRYLSDTDLLQWVVNVFLKALQLDYNNYNDELASVKHFFTPNGWQMFLNQLNIYANYNNVQTNRLFVNGTPAGAPLVTRSGLLLGKYAWWVDLPIYMQYQGMKPPDNIPNLVFQILVVRVPTLDSLDGVAIDNVVVGKPGTSTSTGAGT